jgi:hypothetical protein
MNREIARLEHQIFNLVRSSNNCTPHFDYKNNFYDGTVTLELYTYNPTHGGVILLCEITEEKPVLALNEALEYLKNHIEIKKEKKPYTLFWVHKEDRDNLEDSNISYFYEESEQKVLEKFFKNKEKSDYIYRIKLNPQS